MVLSSLDHGVRSRCVDLCEEEDELMDTLVFVRPTGLETYLVYGPLIVKDSSWPKTICLSVLLESEVEKTPGVSNIDITIGIILEQPSTNGESTPEVFSASVPDKLQVLHDLELTMASERAEFKKAFAVLKEEMLGSTSSATIGKSDIAILKDEIVDSIMSDVVDMLPTLASNDRSIVEDVAGSSSTKISIPQEAPIEDPADFQEDCVEDCGVLARSRRTVVDGLWGKVQCAEEEVPGEEQIAITI